MRRLNRAIGTFGWGIALLCVLCGCDDCLDYFGWKEHPECHKKIVFENNSESELFVDSYFPPESSYNYILSRCIIGALDESFIKPGDVSEGALSISQFEWGKKNYWEWEFERSGYDYVYIVIADAEKVRQRIEEGKRYGEYAYDRKQWPQEAQESPLLAIYKVTLDDLNTLGWSLSYPPAAAMRPESTILKEYEGIIENKESRGEKPRDSFVTTRVSD